MEALVTPRGGAAPIDVDGFRPSPACCASHSATNASHGSTFFDGSPRSSQLKGARGGGGERAGGGVEGLAAAAAAAAAAARTR